MSPLSMTVHVAVSCGLKVQVNTKREFDREKPSSCDFYYNTVIIMSFIVTVIVTLLVVVLLEIRPQWIVQAGLELPVLQSQPPSARIAGMLYHAGYLICS